MDHDRLQYGIDVHGAIFRLFRRSFWPAASAPFFSYGLYVHLASVALFPQPGRVAFSAGGRWTVVRNVLSPYIELRVAQPAAETRNLCYRGLFRRYPCGV